MIAVTPESVADVVSRRCAERPNELSVLWCATATGRNEFARQVELALSAVPAVPIVVSGARFDNPNSILDDFVQLLDAARTSVLQRLSAIGAPRLAAVLLVSRTTLAVPQVSSPAVLPDWVPELGGTTVEVHLEDVTWTATVPLADPALDSPGICTAIFDFDNTAVRRFAAVASSSPTATRSLYDKIRRNEEESLASFCHAALKALDDVKNPEAYRPSVRAGATLVPRLWGLAQAETADRRPRIAKSLSSALLLNEVELFPPDPLVAVLARPATPVVGGCERYALGVLNALVAGCQLTTAAAHADDYPRFPPPLLHTLSMDLQQSLRAASDTIATLAMP